MGESEPIVHAAVGVGPVDAAYRAVDAVVKAPNTLIEYSVHSVTEGINALGEVTVRISPENDGRSFGGYGADGDIIVASVKAYLAALNRMLAALGYGDVEPEGDAATVGIETA
jgi:2-isopropylmalate synthase